MHHIDSENLSIYWKLKNIRILKKFGKRKCSMIKIIEIKRETKITYG